MSSVGRVVDNAAELSYDNDTSLRSSTNMQDLGDELSRAIADIGRPAGNMSPGTYKLYGGDLLYRGTGLNYVVTAGAGYISNVLVTWPETNITFADGDVSNDRFDAVVVTATGAVGAISIVEGIPAENPNHPDIDPISQLELTFKLVVQSETAPVASTTIDVYLENDGTPTEWSWATSSPGTVSLGSTTNPRTGTKCIRGVSVPANATITGTAASPISVASYDVFSFFLKIVTAWGNNRSLRMQFYLGTVAKGNPVTIVPGANGLSNSNTTTYQGLAWLMNLFAFPSGATIDKIVLTVVGGAISFQIDDMTFHAYGGASVVPVGDGGLTLDQTDARYLRITQLFAEIAALGAASQATARTNLGIVVAGGGCNVPLGDGVQTLQANVYVDLIFPFACTLTQVTLLANVAGACQLDLRKCTYAQFDAGATHPVSGDSICSATKPTIPATNTKAQDGTLSGWTIAIAEDEVVRVIVLSATTIKQVTLGLKWTR